jgi:hypothetical protein
MDREDSNIKQYNKCTNQPSTFHNGCSSNPTIIELSNTKYLNGEPTSGIEIPLQYFNKDFSSSREKRDSGPHGGGKAPCNKKIKCKLYSILILVCLAS